MRTCVYWCALASSPSDAWLLVSSWQGGFETAPWLIFKNYLRGFLVIDVLSTVPVATVAGNSNLGNSNRLLKTLRLVRLVKLLRIVKVTPFLLFPPSAP